MIKTILYEELGRQEICQICITGLTKVVPQLMKWFQNSLCKILVTQSTE